MFMKYYKKYHFIIFISLHLIIGNAFGQDSTHISTDEYVEEKNYKIVKNDGIEYVGTILQDDGREILINTANLGKIYIPKLDIKSITEIDQTKIIENEIYGEDFFSTRYFLTTNGLNQNKGEHYSLLSIYGPEVQFAVTDNLTIGGLTSWIGIPIVMSVKYSVQFSKNVYFGMGALGGSLSWVDFSATGALPYGAITFGNNSHNITFSGGYLFLQNSTDSYESPLYSVAGMFKFGDSVAFILDSFGFTDYNNNNNNFLLVMPGLRFGSNDKAFQFGFTQLYVDNQFVPFPIPTVGWFKRF